MIQVIERAFKLIEELSLDGEVSLEALTRISKLNKGTLCNILRSLIELGYVRRTREGYYQLTGKIQELSQGNDIPQSALKIMRETVSSLADATGESGVIGILRHTKVAVVVQAQFQRSLMVNTHEIYAGLSLYGSVTGRILFAYLSDKERQQICHQAGFPGEFWNHAHDMNAVETLCSEIRNERLSVMENPDTEIIAFAVPFRYDRQTLSLGLTMPLCRCRDAEKKRIIGILHDHASALEEHLREIAD